LRNDTQRDGPEQLTDAARHPEHADGGAAIALSRRGSHRQLARHKKDSKPDSFEHQQPSQDGGRCGS